MEGATGTARSFDHLREHSIGLPQVLFQSITHMAPAAAVAFSILVSVQFAGPALPLSVLLALIACALVANSIGQLEEASRMLVEQRDLTIEDAFVFLSVACDAGVAQACKPAEGFGTIARFSIPKIDATPRPFS